MMSQLTLDNLVGSELRRREQYTCKGKTIRTFQIPNLNFEAKMYFGMINWQKVNLTEPPLTRSISDDEINHLISSKELSASTMPHASCGKMRKISY